MREEDSSLCLGRQLLLENKREMGEMVSDFAVSLIISNSEKCRIRD